LLLVFTQLAEHMVRPTEHVCPEPPPVPSGFALSTLPTQPEAANRRIPAHAGSFERFMERNPLLNGRGVPTQDPDLSNTGATPLASPSRPSPDKTVE
jgi:hypothetical protein